ncbi:hypothetical protein VNO77_42492 [Canavalia gladiata]|uniref:pectinesterase n=1 Tax=Canavalia gladiata TaxID=3824 RepID=A0AAN9PP49_CANGL
MFACFRLNRPRSVTLTLQAKDNLNVLKPQHHYNVHQLTVLTKQFPTVFYSVKLNKKKLPFGKRRKESKAEIEMDSLKVFKGYGKVERNHSHLEDQQQQQQQHNPKPKSSKSYIAAIFVFVFAIIFLTLALAFVLTHHTNNTHSPQQQPQPQQQQQHPNSAESIRVVCNVTRFPDSCLAAISPSANATDPEAILALSLRASINSLATLTSSLGTKGPALADCKKQMDDALSRLNDSLSAMATPPKLTDAKISDIQTWVSASLTDQQTCLDGLEEVGDVAAVAEMKKLMQRCSEYISNSLAIVANIRNLLHQFHMPLH